MKHAIYKSGAVNTSDKQGTCSRGRGPRESEARGAGACARKGRTAERVYWQQSATPHVADQLVGPLTSRSADARSVAATICHTLTTERSRPAEIMSYGPPAGKDSGRFIILERKLRIVSRYWEVLGDTSAVRLPRPKELL